MKLEHILLGVLLQRPSTGYDLKKFLDTHGRFLRSNTQMSQVYRALTGMQEQGWVEHEVAHRPGAQDAKTYRVTAEGATVFLDWLTGPYTPPSRFEDPDLLVRLTFAGFMTVDQLLRLIDIELDTHLSYIDQSLEGRDYLVGNAFSAADVQMSFIGELAAIRTDTSRFPNLDAWVRRFQCRPAYQAAIRRGGPYDLGSG